jgi:hypothetical protein
MMMMMAVIQEELFPLLVDEIVRQRDGAVQRQPHTGRLAGPELLDEEIPRNLRAVQIGRRYHATKAVARDAVKIAVGISISILILISVEFALAAVIDVVVTRKMPFLCFSSVLSSDADLLHTAAGLGVAVLQCPLQLVLCFGATLLG